MGEYFITKCDLGYNVYREKDGVKEWLQKDAYTTNQNFAKVFYHMDDAISALQIAKSKWKKEISIISTKKSESEEVREKTSWSELS